MSGSSRVLLGAAILIHLAMLLSWRTGTLNPLFFDATVTHGRRGWDFYALYQAGHNVLTGHSAYESAAEEPLFRREWPLPKVHATQLAIEAAESNLEFGMSYQADLQDWE